MPEAKPVADPNTFFAAMFSGLAQSHRPSTAWEGLARESWHGFRRSVEWVASGQAQRDFDALEAKTAAEAKATAEREAREEREEREWLEKQQKAHGEKASPVAAK